MTESKIKVFCPPGDNEIKKSLQKYFKFVKNAQAEEIDVSEIGSDYFKKVYPAKFGGCELYFIFNDELETFNEDKTITSSGLIFSIIIDLSLSNEYSYKIYVSESEIKDYAGYNGIKVKLSYSDNKDKYDIRKILENIEIISYKELKNVIAHVHNIERNKLDEIRNRVKIGIEQISQENQESQDRNRNRRTAQNSLESKLSEFKELIKNSIFVLIIDDVLGDYKKTFLPFYTLLKSKFNKNLIMRGISDPSINNLIGHFQNFPADIILVDIDFKEVAQKWEEKKLSEYKFYYTEGAQMAGVRIFEQLISFTNTGVFSKRTEVKVFTSLTKEKDDFKGKWIEKGEFLDKINIKNLTKFSKSYEEFCKNYYLQKNSEDTFKKIVYLRKYKFYKKNYNNPTIWDLIILKANPGKKTIGQEANGCSFPENSSADTDKKTKTPMMRYLSCFRIGFILVKLKTTKKVLFTPDWRT